MRRRPPLPRLLAALVLLLIPLAVFHRSLLFGEAFLPADLLRYVAPWSALPAPSPEPAAAPPAWNVLRFDGIAQFYPWRLEAARAVRSGRLPLRNPYQFAGEGGAPLLANSQSAPLYPPNVLFYGMPVWRAFGWAAALHLLLAAAGTYAFLRALPVHRAAALLGAVTFSLCGPIATWLALPTFLAVACWLPWLLLLVKRAHDAAGTPGGRLAALGAGATAGTLVLAGHPQMAFYCLFAAGLYALWLGAHGVRAGRVRPLPWLLAVAGATLLALALAAPQALPAVELSRVSHRRVPPSWPGYGFYLANALPARNLVTLLAPDFFGHPNAGSYWNPGSGPAGYAEWALYVGVLPLLLAAYAAFLPRRRDLPPERGFFAGLALLGLLLALGTPVNVLFFFGIPGWAQTGSPARVLVLVGFSLAVLAALGLHARIEGSGEPTPRRTLAAAIAVPLLLAVAGAVLVPLPAADMLALAGPGLALQATLLVVGAALLVLAGRGAIVAALCVGVAALDLFSWGMGFNSSSSPEAVYPVTPGIRWLQRNAGDALIAPLNRTWSLGVSPPEGAVLPPNALTVYRLHDLSGYDSLIPRRVKRRIEVVGGENPSPPENGNLVFIKSARAARALGARFLVTAPGVGDLEGEARLRRVYTGPDMTIYENAQGGRAVVPAGDAPASFRVGLFLGLSGMAVLAAAAGAMLWRRRGRS